MTNLVFLDCETTSLRRDCRIWEIGAIARPPGGQGHEQEHHWFIRTEDLNLGEADPFSLDIGRFYQRHPQMSGVLGGSVLGAERHVLAEVEKVCRGAHIVGNVVNFDTQRLDARMADCGLLWNGHYHLIDVEALAIGWIAAQPRTPDTAEYRAALLGPPWDSADLSHRLGIKVPEEDRHTALGDARWAMAVYDKVMGVQ